MNEGDDYTRRATHEANFFRKQQAKFNQLPPMVNWLSERYMKPRVEAIFNTAGPIDFYAKPISQKAKVSDKTIRVISIGSGDGEIEMKIGELLKSKGVTNFVIEGYELSKDLVEASNKLSCSKSLSDNIRFIRSDLNIEAVEPGVDFVIANQILHHILDLEILFQKVFDALTDDGIIMTRDMIGKNGHQAWPEAKTFIDAIWAQMPERYKFNHRKNEVFIDFPNSDFSTDSFEGIRAQDILQLMLKKFHFSHFYAFGGIVEKFINRGFGHNYSVDSEEDNRFASMLQEINDALLDGRFITPTQMMAYATKKNRPLLCWKDRTPERSVRQLNFS